MGYILTTLIMAATIVSMGQGCLIACLAGKACRQDDIKELPQQDDSKPATSDETTKSFSPNFDLLQPRTKQDHDKPELGSPCFVHYRAGDRELVFLGTRHGIRLHSPSHRLIEQVIQAYQPDCVVIEGSETRMGKSHPGLLKDARRMVADGACPEPLFAAVLAAERQIDFMGGEPPPSNTTEALRNLGSDRDALGWLVVRQLGQVRREEGLEQLDARVKELLRRIKRRFELKTEMEIVDFKKWFFERTEKPFSAENLRFARTAPLAGPSPTFFEKAAIDVMLAREKHLLSLEAELLATYHRVLVVYGGGHLVYEEPVLRDMLGKPFRNGTRW
ncbi:MAG: hypothetical protein P8K79_10290 [Mariniblastus sp.]|nr:hypothetical protein [Mariniblastus sp.]